MELGSVAIYRRRIRASLARVWENVHDWEHLPWLHHQSFSAIGLDEAGDFGWRARIGLRAAGDPEIRLELVRDGELAYVSRTLEGLGAGSEIWTRLSPRGADTDIEVEFLLPGVAPGRRDDVGRGYVALYTQLWDQDEAMMQRRALLLGAKTRAPGAPPEPLDLGPLAELEGRLPLRVAFGGRPVAVVRDAGELVAFDALCPHLLGPLDEGAIEDGLVVCPWHGYAYDLRSGAGCGAAKHLKLAAAPKVEIAAGRVWLVPA